ncbi:hypothetical protein [Cellulophaga sp. L1A9]|uniref:hypothetical protein n=1 Tax=Cellulophaga sp. L1A9 TaxID=2686362 RepID=UPI00131AF3E1|nr:hypothetical protein [Cellulophaga sp. L1A9]
MKRFLLFSMLLSQIALSAQSESKLQVIESVPFVDKVEATDVVAMHINDIQETGVIRFNKGRIIFDVFNNSLERINNEIISIERKEEFKASLYFDNEIKVITLYSPRKKERIVFCYTFNIKDKSYSKKQLFEKTLEGNSVLFSGENKRQTNFVQSTNGKYLAMTSDNIKKKSNAYSIHLFDANSLELIFEKSYQEDVEKHFELNDLMVDDNANVFVLGKLFFKGRSNKRNDKANYEFVINRVNSEGIHVQSIGLDQEQIKSLNISFKKGKLHLLGFYSEQNVDRIKGGCDFQLDPISLLVEDKKLSPLPLTVFEDLYGNERAENKKDTELSNFYVDYALEDSLGNTYMLAEEFYVTSNYVNTGQFGGYMTTTTHFDDIIILKFNSSGILEWGRSIFKRSTSPSYNAFLKGNQLHVILNSGKNLKDKIDGRTKVSKRLFESTALYDISFAQNGEVEYNKIQDNKGVNFYLPSGGTIKNETFIMMNARGTEKSLMLLK